LCFELDQPAKLRLLLARGGATTLETSAMPAPADGPVACAIVPLPVVTGDWRLRHKSTDRAFYEMALELAKDEGAGEALLIRDDGLLTEGSFTSLFVERDGRLLTPPLRLGLLPGVLRAALIAEGRAKEAELRAADLAGGFLLGNSVRGLMPARLLQP
jgi:para-aminobenzoate synthetase/4-amino-4-deoxychorismate lyase